MPFERYADDAVIHCATERQARQVWAALDARLTGLGLQLHPDKTRIVYCKDNRRRGSYEHVSFTLVAPHVLVLRREVSAIESLPAHRRLLRRNGTTAWRPAVGHPTRASTTRDHCPPMTSMRSLGRARPPEALVRRPQADRFAGRVVRASIRFGVQHCAADLSAGRARCCYDCVATRCCAILMSRSATASGSTISCRCRPGSFSTSHPLPWASAATSSYGGPKSR